MSTVFYPAERHSSVHGPVPAKTSSRWTVTMLVILKDPYCYSTFLKVLRSEEYLAVKA